MLIDDYIDYSRITKDIWRRLACESKHELIKILKRVEKEEGGYGTIIVPPDGFSCDEITHNLIINWLENKGVNVYSVENEVEKLKDALNCKVY